MSEPLSFKSLEEYRRWAAAHAQAGYYCPKDRALPLNWEFKDGQLVRKAEPEEKL